VKIWTLRAVAVRIRCGSIAEDGSMPAGNFNTGSTK
jgi:hypothetical protein